ncbi:MAG: nucleotidyltransferase domain-containing protein [Clostridia bacterium]|jgi:predicted nucleotidyltransferase|nr:nucleotidyltransferase domain-containing protein [Clostridia bacterium]
MSEKIYTIEEIKAILTTVLDNMPVYSVVLFGSYAKNCATKNSDLDFIIDTKENLKGFKLFSLITKIEEAFKKEVDAFEKAEIIENSKIDNEIKRTGVVVYEK